MLIFVSLAITGWLGWYCYLFYFNLIPRQSIALAWPVEISWYGLFIALGTLTGFLIASYWSNVRKLNINEFYNLIIIALLAGIVGGRLVYVLLDPYYASHLNKVWYITSGGLSIHGTVALATIALLLWAKYRKIKILPYLDVLALGLLCAQIIGRVGNLFNQELYGPPTNLPWKLAIDPEFRAPQFLNEQYFHPYFLYEIIGNFILITLLWRLAKHKPKPGRLFVYYLAGYSAVRFITEFWRINTGFDILGISLSQLVSLFVIVVFFLLLAKGTFSRENR